MESPVKPYKNTSESKKSQVTVMFNNIAHKYDFLNQLLSFGIHNLWRKKAIKLLKKNNPKIILDVATGTGDFAIEAVTLHPEKIEGIDISEGMLNLGIEKIKNKNLSDKIHLQVGDAENLPFQDNYFDALTIGFGVRNFEDLEKGLSEMYRVLKPNGTAIILEFSKPSKFPVKQAYNFYFRKICPFVGKIFSKDNSAYTYLPDSVSAFPFGEEFIKILKKTGFKETKIYSLTFGIASIYEAKK